MNEGSLTGIQLSKETRDRLKAMKVYARESYEEVIRRLLEAPRTRKSGAGRPPKAKTQPIMESSTEATHEAFDEALQNDYKES